MSKAKNTKTHINITFPDGNHLHFDIQEQLTPVTCLSAIKNQPLVFWYTNGQFETKSGPITENKDLSKDVNEKSTLELTFKEQEYNLETALNHIQQTARIIFSLTSHPEVTDCCQSVVSWMTRTYGNFSSGKKVPTEQDYAEYFPENYQNSANPKLVKYFDILDDSKPSNEGIFIKIKIITKEKKELIIDATKKGFSIENTNNENYSTLYYLLYQNSQYFQDNSQLVAARWMTLDKIEKSPYRPINQQHIYADNRKGNIKPQLHLFRVNKEILTGSVEDAISNINTNNQLNCYICLNIEEQYLKQICDSVKKIEAGKIQPENEGDKIIYNDNGVKLTKINNIDEYKSFTNYIKSIDDLKNISPYIKAERPIIVEYIGQIYIVKPNKGDDDFISHVTQNLGEEDIDFTKLFCDKFSCKSLPEGINGFHKELTFENDTQKKCTILTYVPRTTPRDANFPDDQLCLLRPEILHSYEVHAELTKHSDELTKLGGDPLLDFTHNPNDKDFSEEQMQTLSKRRNEIINQTEAILYDLNLTNEEVKTDKTLNDIADFIKSYVISNFVNLFLTTVNCPMDGNFIVQKMHTCGLNVRYLGYLLPYLPIGTNDEKPMNKTFSMAIESEIIIRSFKHIVRSNNYSIDVLLEKINTIVNFEKDPNFGPLFESICEVSQKKFNTRPNKITKEQLPYLRRGLMVAFGIVIGIKKGHKEDDPIQLQEVTEITPHCKFCFTKNNEYIDTLRQATRAFNSNDISTAYKLFQTVIQLSKQSVPKFDESLIDCFFYCAIIFYRTKRLDMAYQMMMKATIMQERHVGFTDTSLLSKYSMLGSIANEFGNKRLAFVLFARACVLLKLIAPSNPWIIDVATDAATAASNFDADIALKFSMIAIDACKRSMPAREVDLALSTCYATAASISLSSDKLLLAAKFADEAVKLNPASKEYKELKENINTYKQRHSAKRGGARGRRRGGH